MNSSKVALKRPKFNQGYLKYDFYFCRVSIFVLTKLHYFHTFPPLNIALECIIKIREKNENYSVNFYYDKKSVLKKKMFF